MIEGLRSKIEKDR